MGQKYLALLLVMAIADLQIILDGAYLYIDFDGDFNLLRHEMHRMELLFITHQSFTYFQDLEFGLKIPCGRSVQVAD